ncbi:MAG: phosphotransferase [Pseudomonadota bacterium]
MSKTMGDGAASRHAKRESFLAAAGWDSAPLTPLAGDASTRSYARLRQGEENALLMDAPLGGEAASCPPDADEVERQRLGYNAMARLAGPRMEAFTAVAKWLNNSGVRAPHIYASDPGQGFALIQDFGNRHLVDAATDAAAEAALYRRAMDVLGTIRQQAVIPGDIGGWHLLTYDALVLKTEADLLLDWYVPHLGGVVSDEMRADWVSAWDELIDKLGAPDTLVLRDYHAENILVPDDGPLAVIDFQDALVGHAPYDVVSLLEDARRDVDLGLAAELYQEDRARAPDPGAYGVAFAVLAAQRNAKILGIFARLIHRDNKERYAAFIPRVARHMARDLERSEVAPLRGWAERYLPSLLGHLGGV